MRTPLLISTKWTLIFFALFASLGLQAQTVWYVAHGAPGPSNGQSWTNAFPDIESAFSASASGDEIWVKAGIYKPNASSARYSTFNLPSGVALYGGFAGNETQVNQRDPQANSTNLSGDIGIAGNSSDNCYHVVTVSPGVHNVILDGFRVNGGNANGSSWESFGGGLFMNMGSGSIQNCNFSGNFGIYGGGAQLLTNGVNHSAIENCSFGRNRGQTGAGLSIISLGSTPSTPLIRRCTFRENQAASWGGALLVAASSSGDCEAILDNCLFFRNHADHVGGAVYNWGLQNAAASPTFVNCTFADNDATNFGGVATTDGNPNSPSRPTFKNCILWGNTAATYDISSTDVPAEAELTFDNCLIQSGACGPETGGNTVCTNIFTANPLFVSNNDFRLQAGSPALDMGVNAYLPTGSTEDLDGNTRIMGGTVDLGCFEFDPPCHTGPIVYVNHVAAGGNDGSTWADAYTDLKDALTKARNCATVNEIWVAEGIYEPTATTDRNATFELVDGVDMYGGFPNPMAWGGGNPGMANRAVDTYVSLLSGDIGTAGINTDNSYHIVTAADLSPGTVFDGFHLQGGYADMTESFSPYKVGYGAAFHYQGQAAGVGIALNDCRFRDNWASYGAAAVMWASLPGNQSDFSIHNTLFEGNICDRGWGGAAFSSPPWGGDMDGAFEACTFIGNSSNDRAPAVLVFEIGNLPSELRFSDCQFIGNTNNGNEASGALTYFSLNSANRLVVERSVFRSNNTSGLECIGHSSNPLVLELSNSEFYDNQEFRTTGFGLSPYDAGGALRIFDALSTINHCTFVGNRSQQGGAIFMSSTTSGYSEADCYNSIFWDNQAMFSNPWNNTQAVLNNESTGNFRIEYSLMQGANCAAHNLTGGAGRLTCGPGMLYNQNPVFVNQAGGNLELDMGSPAINAGDLGNSLPGDLYGNPRPTGAGVDMGCYESPFPSPPLHVDNSTLGLTCYPNPAQNRVKVSMEGEMEIGVLALIDLNGRTIREQAWEDSVGEFDLSDLGSGIYFVQLRSASGVQTQRLVIAK